eukprot:TRINITY_DN58751_c0_g1_i1.p1 TRINITY_DN58751_c0_g1~~TRINITY_DN58751_c0_g1_i1.p1  ORF type:complete len:176 (-),score=15.77 TRINITY_DN58751_c0_g1_i1:84-611(-)
MALWILPESLAALFNETLWLYPLRPQSLSVHLGSGYPIQGNFEAARSISELRTAVAKAAGIHAACVRLVLEHSVLEDSTQDTRLTGDLELTAILLREHVHAGKQVLMVQEEQLNDMGAESKSFTIYYHDGAHGTIDCHSAKKFIQEHGFVPTTISTDFHTNYQHKLINHIPPDVG